MKFAFRLSIGLVAVAIVLAQTISPCYGQVIYRTGTMYATPPGGRSFRNISPYYIVATPPDFNGHDPGYYSFAASWQPPTYMTSINYPRIYGAYAYGPAPGRIIYGLSQPPYSTQPTIYDTMVPTIATLTSARILPVAAATAGLTTASVDVRVPANAEVRFDGQLTAEGGALRRFVTPPLQAGTAYTYDVSASWPAAGGTTSRDRHIEFHAGDRVVVDFTLPSPTTGTSTLRTRPLP